MIAPHKAKRRDAVMRKEKHTMILADKIISLRKKAGWSQEELAEQLGVTRQSVSKWEGAQSVPDMDKVVQMSRLFGVTTDFLLKDEIEEQAAVPAEEKSMLRRVTMAQAADYLARRRAAAEGLFPQKAVVSHVRGGAQERTRRAGTENVPGIVGLEAAVKRAVRILDEKTARKLFLRDYLIRRIEEEIPYCSLNGHRTSRLPGNVNFSFRFIEGESVLIMLDMKGICASSGSACTSGSVDPSHVLLAIGRNQEEAHGSLRLTLSEENTQEELDYVVEQLKQIVQKLRDMSQLYEAFIRKNGGK